MGPHENRDRESYNPEDEGPDDVFDGTKCPSIQIRRFAPGYDRPSAEVRRSQGFFLVDRLEPDPLDCIILRYSLEHPDEKLSALNLYEWNAGLKIKDALSPHLVLDRCRVFNSLDIFDEVPPLSSFFMLNRNVFRSDYTHTDFYNRIFTSCGLYPQLEALRRTRTT